MPLRICSVEILVQVLLAKWYWKRELVIFAPDWPEKTNMESWATATGKLQHVGGDSPVYLTSSQTRGSVSFRLICHMSFNLAFPSYPDFKKVDELSSNSRLIPITVPAKTIIFPL